MTRHQSHRDDDGQTAVGGPVARALVCLGDPHDSATLAADLRGMDMAVVVSASARDARDAMAFGTPDVVVVEVADGDEPVAIEVLRSAMSAGALALAVVPMSALGSGSDALWAAGLREVFHRPLDVPALAARIGAGFDWEPNASGPSTRIAEAAPAHEPDTAYAAPPVFEPATLAGPAPEFDPMTLGNRGAAEADGPDTVNGAAPDFASMLADVGPEVVADPVAPAPDPTEQPAAEQDAVTPDPAPPEEPAFETELPAAGVDPMVDELMSGLDFGDLPLPQGMGVDPAAGQPATAEPASTGAADTNAGEDGEEPSIVNPWDSALDLGFDAGPLSDVDAILASAGVSKPLFDPSAMATDERPVPDFDSTQLPNTRGEELGADAAVPTDAADSTPDPQQLETAREMPVLDREALGLAADEPENSSDEEGEEAGLHGDEEAEPEAGEEESEDGEWDGPSTGEMIRASMPVWRRNPWIGRAVIGALAAVMLGQLGYLGYRYFAPAESEAVAETGDNEANTEDGEGAGEEAKLHPSEVPEVPTVEEETTKAYGEGVLAAKAGDLDGAARHYRHILRKPVDHEGGMAGLSAVLIQQGHFDEARKLLLQLATDKPQDALVQLDLGLVANELDDSEAARTALKRYLELAPADHEHREDVMRLVLSLDAKSTGT